MDLQKLQISIQDELCRRKLSKFAERFWDQVCPESPLVMTRHIEAICDHLQAVTEGKIRKLIINVPPGSGKSVLVSVLWTAWEWLQNPGLQVQYASYAAPLTERDSLRCRELVDSHRYLALIPAAHPWKRKRLPDRNTEYGTSAGGWRRCTSISGVGTGFRGHRVVVDDPHNIKDNPTPKELADVASWWDHRMSSRFVDMAKAQLVIIMQRVHENDLSGHCLEQGGYEHLCLPSEYDSAHQCKTSIGFKDWRTEDGELLNPAYHPAEVLAEAKRILGSRQYAGQHQQRPAPKGGLIVHTNWIKKYNKLPTGSGTWMQSWDLRAGGKGKATSFVVGQVWFRPDQQPHCYLVDQVRERWDIVGTIQAIQKLSKKWPQATRKLVEDKADGKAVLRLLQDELTGLVPTKVSGSKEQRLEAVSPLYEAGNVWVPGKKDWTEDHINELTSFPASRYNDQVDAASQALEWFRTHPHRAVGIRKVPINGGRGSRKKQWV